MKTIAAALGPLGTLAVLGAVQGVTEFLPVSSSAHLLILADWFGLARQHGLAREAGLHLGTLVAVTIFCRRDLGAMLRGGGWAWRLTLGATAVTGALGLPFKDAIETSLATPLVAGCCLLGTAALLGLVAPSGDGKLTRRVNDATWRDALVLGLFQACALLPGISRSGTTLVAALLLGFRRPDALRIAFLLAIPAVAGALALQLREAPSRAVLADPGMLLGLVVAGLTGLAALRFIAVHVDARSLRGFALYCLCFGAAAIAGPALVAMVTGS